MKYYIRFKRPNQDSYHFLDARIRNLNNLIFTYQKKYRYINSLISIKKIVKYLNIIQDYEYKNHKRKYFYTHYHNWNNNPYPKYIFEIKPFEQKKKHGKTN